MEPRKKTTAGSRSRKKSKPAPAAPAPRIATSAPSTYFGGPLGAPLFLGDSGVGVPVAELRCDQGRGTSVIVVACSPLNGFVLLFARGKGLRGAPKGWMIRKDRDRATGSGAIHYHCEKNGKEYVVKADGTGSHQTKSGTRLPPKLGEFLFKELGIPLKKVNDEFVVVRFIPFWRWNSSLERFAKDLLESALNADLVEQPGFATT